jgi:hypothetical protein
MCQHASILSSLLYCVATAVYSVRYGIVVQPAAQELYTTPVLYTI